MALTTSALIAAVTPMLTTTFSAIPTSCMENRLTMLENKAYEIWMNDPVPVPGTTFSDCYAPQFMTSYIQLLGHTTQAAFDPLICPVNYSTVGPFTSNYIACCPSGYSWAQPSVTPFADRPAFGGTCYTPINIATPVVVTAYGSESVTATTTFSATVTNAQAYAYPYEGYAFGVAQGPGAASSTAALTSLSSIPVPTKTGSGSTYIIIAAAGPTFIPPSVSAKIGDTVLFQFSSGNHSVTQSTFETPCEAEADGFDSGLMGNNATELSLSVNVSVPQWFYSKGPGDCVNGMVFALNPSSSQTDKEFTSNAVSSPSSKSAGVSTGTKVGVAIAAIASAVLLISLLLLFIRYQRRQHDNKAIAHDHKSFQSSSSAPISPRINQGFQNNYGRDVRPIDTYSYAVNYRSGAPTRPPKGQELHGISCPTALAQFNDRPVELQGSEGGEFAMIAAYDSAIHEKQAMAMSDDKRTHRPHYPSVGTFGGFGVGNTDPATPTTNIGMESILVRTVRSMSPTTTHHSIPSSVDGGSVSGETVETYGSPIIRPSPASIPGGLTMRGAVTGTFSADGRESERAMRWSDR